MTRKFKSIICSMLAVLILSSLFIVPAGAEPGGSLKIEFYKPEGWADTVKIHLWNAGTFSTQWPGVDMTRQANGTYLFENAGLSGSNFVINDGANHQTVDLYAHGNVVVKDNAVIKKCVYGTRLNFKKPADWGADVYAYYYTNDENEVNLTPWPGKALSRSSDGSYFGRITDMDDARVIFTDGVHQYPDVLKPGMVVKDGQELIFRDGKYTVDEYKWVQVDQPVSTVCVNQDLKVKAVMDTGSDFPLMFFDNEKNAYVDPVSYTTVKDNNKVTREYTFNFAETGNKSLEVRYYYSSSIGYTGKTIYAKVLPQGSAATFTSSEYDLMQGEEFTLTASYNEVLYYSVQNDAGQQITPKSVTYSGNNGYGAHTKVHMTFSADQVGQFQKLHLYEHNKYYPVAVDTGNFVMLNVWAKA